MALPLICAFFPIDALASIMDGSLLAAKQSNYMSATQIGGALMQYVVLAGGCVGGAWAWGGGAWEGRGEGGALPEG